ncbi:tRNA (adenosine(37)-N6)-dimethylallyltransferase MiaA [Sphingomonas sp. LY160]|uniref:tRNA (adenosine(37)-N6)-dimethylallyltransferase MiaA n=1 Tax=Sphingomonas sp. LY160 TaxID=3095342 RepID=UPI002ADED043|nr:tRNA (adenosine(37)-N6)-dimethylallyltransferase MiaA [Sphingomonas sp. LY160]MEA1071054.1 tRNA (adenosine(37)-N6)-dimethylallyltransferase MiaA [Sphingomonas sp. LY160]
MVTSRPPVLLIAGPTASGKSALALAAAERWDGVIVNADSAQLYRDVPILSAAPCKDDRRRADHRLYGFRDGAEPCSAAEWAALAKQELADIYERGRVPILVGGTGLYIRTLLDGIAPIPPIDPAVRAEVRGAGVAENLAALTLLDPVSAASLNAGDTTRIARALEVVKSTGTTIGRWQQQKEGGIVATIEVRPIILCPDRAWLNARCDARFETMVEVGAVEEVEKLRARHLDPQLPVMRAIGVGEIGAYLDGHLELDQAVAAGQAATRRYAKRQYTWFSHQPPAHWPRFAEPPEKDGLERALAHLGPKE